MIAPKAVALGGLPYWPPPKAAVSSMLNVNVLPEIEYVTDELALAVSRPGGPRLQLDGSVTTPMSVVQVVLLLMAIVAQAPFETNKAANVSKRQETLMMFLLIVVLSLSVGIEPFRWKTWLSPSAEMKQRCRAGG